MFQVYLFYFRTLFGLSSWARRGLGTGAKLEGGWGVGGLRGVTPPPPPPKVRIIWFGRAIKDFK